MASPVRFIHEVREELQKVTYPTRKEVIRLTVIVIGISLALSFFLGFLDLIFGKLIEFTLGIH